jgi:hypothetical protein
MKKFILSVLMLSIGLGGYFSDNFLKYSTFYTSVSLESPFTPKQKFAVNTQEGTFKETTEEIEGSYNLSFGIRKLARFKYQSKKGNFYDGSENELSDVAPIGAVSGWEYLIKFSKLRQFGEEFVDSESWIRYLGDWFVIKGSYARLRKPIGTSWNFTGGVNFRGHPAYGLFPFDKWVKDNNNQWWELAYLYGYYDVEYQIDEDWSDFNWYNEDDEVVAETDGEFYEYVYGDLIHQYNEDETAKIGWQYEVSAAIGVDYYLYQKKYWIHSWVSVMPYSKGLTPHSFKYKKGDVDHDFGLVTGWKFNRNFGVFGEGRHLSYWGIDSYELKAGLNFTFF